MTGIKRDKARALRNANEAQALVDEALSLVITQAQRDQHGKASLYAREAVEAAAKCAKLASTRHNEAQTLRSFTTDALGSVRHALAAL